MQKNLILKNRFDGKMKFNRRYALAGLFCLIYLSLTVSGALPSASIGTDLTDDVEKIDWSASTYDYQLGNFKDEIDIVSVDVVENVDQITLSVTFQAPPVIDATHLYWIWISFVSDGGEDSGAGAWFHTGGFTDTVASSWMVAKDVTDYLNIGIGDDAPTIVSNSMSWTTNSSYWDDLSNSNNWDVGVWAWTSDGQTYTESILSGISYWDYYPNDESSWEGTSDNTSTTTTGSDDKNDGSTPGFELYASIFSLALIPVILRKRK